MKNNFNSQQLIPCKYCKKPFRNQPTNLHRHEKVCRTKFLSKKPISKISNNTIRKTQCLYCWKDYSTSKAKDREKHEKNCEGIFHK